MLYYDEKVIDYYRHIRLDIIKALPKGPFNSVLELGAGGCDTIAFMKEKKLAKSVTGVELFDMPGTNQKNPAIDNMIIGDVAQLKAFNLKRKNYDLIICGDVLEHTYSPWDVLAEAKELLTDDGTLICSIPNFRFYGNMINIFFKGDFKYTSEGILDKTHVRFFCKKNLVDLFEDSGFNIIDIEPTFKYNTLEGKRKTANTLTFGLFKQFLTFQYLLQVKKK